MEINCLNTVKYFIKYDMVKLTAPSLKFYKIFYIPCGIHMLIKMRDEW